jgi:hypothetical protein
VWQFADQKKFADLHILEIFGFAIADLAPESADLKTLAWPNLLRGLGKLIHEKNLKSKISWRCPFKLSFACTNCTK